MNIRVDLNTYIKDGTEVIFRSPVDCSQVTGLKVYYIGDDGVATSKEFAFADAHGNNVGDIDHLFAENVAVKVILDVTTGMAFVQNADTNAYIERTFVKSVNGVTPDENGNVEVAGGGVTCEQIGAVTKEQHDFDIKNVTAHVESVEGMAEDTKEHMDWFLENGATKAELQTSVGDIETALDSIIAIQNQLIGGDAV